MCGLCSSIGFFFFFFQAEDGIRDLTVTGVQTCALPISHRRRSTRQRPRVRAAPEPPAGAAGDAAGLGVTVRVLPPPHAERTSLEGPAGALQALIETPVTEGEGPQPVSAFAVVCHPHPLHGGTLDNKVVYTVARALEQLGAPAIRFNFRGVGASAGGYDAGRGETADALAVVAYGRRRWPQA